MKKLFMLIIMLITIISTGITTIADELADEEEAIVFTAYIQWIDEDDSIVHMESITIPVRATVDGEPYDVSDVFILNTENQYRMSLYLPAVSPPYKYIVYSIELPNVDGYEGSYIFDKNVFTITYRRKETEKTSIRVLKQWNDYDNEAGIRPQSVTVQLQQNNENYLEPIQLSADNNWEYTWNDLPKEESITYSVIEVGDISPYQSTITQNKNTFIITNTYILKISIQGKKTWMNDTEQTRPEFIKVQLLANNQTVTEKTICAADDWKYEFNDLDKYDANGLITYTVKEERVENYSVTIQGYDIINTYVPPATPTITPTPTPTITPTPSPSTPPKPTDPPKEREPRVPNTSDNALMKPILLLCMSVAVIGYSALRLKRK